MRRDLAGFALLVFATLTALFVLNALPAAFGGEPLGVLRYESPDDVQARLRVSLWAPHLAHGATGRPSPVRVAVGPPDWVQFVVDAPPGRNLIVCQTLQAADMSAVPPRSLQPRGELLQEEPVVVGDRAAIARRVLLADGIIVHELWWREGDRKVAARLRGQLDELLRAVGPDLRNRH